MREAHGITVTAAARLINASVSKVSRLERAESPPDARDVDMLAGKYGATPAGRADLKSLARRAVEPEWFDRYSDYAASWMQRLIALESEAVYFCAYEARIAPGLLQTAAYARQIISDGLRVGEGDQVEQRVELRGSGSAGSSTSRTRPKGSSCSTSPSCSARSAAGGSWPSSCANSWTTATGPASPSSSYR